MQPDEYQLNTIKYLDNMLVLAGAGCGKTFCIIKKIEYLKNNFNVLDEEILVVSFTNESVNDLKRKLNNNIDIFTFHKLALHIINNDYKLTNDSLLNFIIDEYFYSIISLKEKRKLCRYFFNLNYTSLIKTTNFKSFKKMIFTYIKLIKANNLNLDYLKTVYKEEKDICFITIIIKIYQIYEFEKKSQNKIDLDDLIILASKVKKRFKYKHIFIDEFQDTSQIRFNLIKNIYNNSNSKLYFYGDDFQSIYHFSGCNLNIMLDLDRYIKNIKIFKLKTTFRNSQELINIANNFIMKNKSQIKKEMLSFKRINNPIEIIYFDNPKLAFKKIIDSLDIFKTLVLGRNQRDIFLYTNNPDIKYLTVHKSKGLEAENIILLNISDDIYGFPNKIKNYYLLDKINKCDEIKYAEERRLFYVALTRTKNKIFILTPRKNPSIFIKELKKLIKK